MNTWHIYEVCKPVKIFGGVYAKDTYIKTVKQEKLYVVNTDPSWAPGEHWFVVDHTQEPCVVFDSYGVVTTVFFMVFYGRRVEPLVLVIRCRASREIVPMIGTILCVRCVCQLLEPSMITVYMYLLSLTRYVRLFYTLIKWSLLTPVNKCRSTLIHCLIDVVQSVWLFLCRWSKHHPGPVSCHPGWFWHTQMLFLTARFFFTTVDMGLRKIFKKIFFHPSRCGT